MKFRAIVKVNFGERITELECDVRDGYNEAVKDGEISRAAYHGEFISYKVVEV